VGSDDDPEIEGAQRATQRWAEFPVDNVPRPLVLVESVVRVEEAISGPAKITFAIGAVDGDESVPTAVLDILRTPRLFMDNPPDRGNITVKNARFGSCAFVTDRGPQLFAAWQMNSDDVVGPIWVLDPDIAASAWSPAEPLSHLQILEGRGRSGATSHDERTITFEFLGGVPDRVDYATAEVVETRTAVAIFPKPTNRDPSDSGRVVSRLVSGSWSGLITTRTVTVDLERPLGARVLTDTGGQALPVTPVS
jgi:hypothetical protein